MVVNLQCDCWRGITWDHIIFAFSIWFISFTVSLGTLQVVASFRILWFCRVNVPKKFNTFYWISLYIVGLWRTWSFVIHLPFLKKILFLFFKLCVSVYGCVHMNAVPTKARRGHQMRCSWSSNCESPRKAKENQSWVPVRGVSALNHRAISPSSFSKILVEIL